MAVLAPQAPKRQQQSGSGRQRPWYERISKLGYLVGAVLLHVVVFVLLATYVIFPAFRPPADDFNKTFVPPAPPPPPPPQQQTMEVPTATAAPPTTTITSPNATPSFTVPIPDITPAAAPVQTNQKPVDKVVTKPNTLSPARLTKIMETEQKWGRDRNNVLQSGGDPHNVVAHFPVYLASYADGDWSYGHAVQGKSLVNGALPDLVAKINEWSHGNITGEVMPQALDIGSPDLMDKRPPFVYFTGHKDFTLTEQEIQNLRDYLQAGGCIWGDNALAGRGSRFDVAFRREMKRVVPDVDKQFEPYDTTADVFNKSWYPLTKLPPGMNFYAEPIEHLDIDGKLAIFYTPNDYTDMFTMRILPGDQKWKRGIDRKFRGKMLIPEVLDTPQSTLSNRHVFFRNFELEPCLDCQKLGMNVVGFLLVRFDKDLLLTP